MPDLVGQQLGHYRLTRLLGHGGFADVYLGEHIYLDTSVAIKVLDTRLSQDEIDQFLTEARTIAHLEHPHIVRVLDFGVENGLPFLVMSYASHGTMRQRYPRGTRLSPEYVVPLVKQVADALHYAHEQRFIHRDVKPENMLLGRNDEILLSDFGLAVVAQSSARSGHYNVSGTVLYMAPEQARGRPQPASDQYALGVAIYEWLCGTRPFQGTYEEVIVQHALQQPPPLREKQPGISAAIEAVVLKGLAKDPQQRFRNVQEFARALEAAVLAESGNDPTACSPVTIQTTPAAQREDTHPTERTASDTIYAVAWSPDRKHLAYGGQDRTISVRGAATGASTLLYRGHNGSVTTIAWSPNGQLIASASLDHTIQVWKAPTGQRLSTYAMHTGMVYALAWSPDSTRLASTSSGDDHSVQIWDISSESEKLSLRGHTYWVRALAWSPDGSALASGSMQDIHIWEGKTGKKAFTYRGHNSWIRALVWSPDGTRIASAGEDKTVQVWEPHNKGRLITTQRIHSDWITMVAWSPNGTWLASGGRDGQVQIWDAASGSLHSTHRVRTTSAYAITWLTDSKHVVAAAGNGSIQVWQVS
jgi:WD40 repeat protein/tRNA A-37 threonylcarbamoyl transferase component Bud32